MSIATLGPISPAVAPARSAPLLLFLLLSRCSFAYGAAGNRGIPAAKEGLRLIISGKKQQKNRQKTAVARFENSRDHLTRMPVGPSPRALSPRAGARGGNKSQPIGMFVDQGGCGRDGLRRTRARAWVTVAATGSQGVGRPRGFRGIRRRSQPCFEVGRGRGAVFSRGDRRSGSARECGGRSGRNTRVERPGAIPALFRAVR